MRGMRERRGSGFQVIQDGDPTPRVNLTVPSGGFEW